MALTLLLRNKSLIQGLPRASAYLVKDSVGKVLNNESFCTLSLQTSTNYANNLQQSRHKFSLEIRRMNHSDHGKLWTIEKGLSAALLGIVPATFLISNPVLDNLFAVAVVTHFHFGIEACVIDYVRPIIFGPTIPKLSLGLLYLVSAATLGGLLYYNYNSIGIGATVKKIWKIKE